MRKLGVIVPNFAEQGKIITLKNQISMKIVPSKLLIIVLLCTSCSTFYYYPSQHNVLNFRKKNDKSFAMGITPNLVGYLNAGYAFTENVFINSTIEASGYYDGGFWFGEQGASRLWKNEVGFYKNIKNFYPALNVGYSFGKFGIEAYEKPQSLNQFFLQPSIGYSNPKHIDVAVSLKATKNSFYRFSNATSYSNTYIEPAFTFGANILSAKLRYQVSYIATKSDDVSRLNSLHTFSVHYIIAGDRKSKKTAR